MKRTTRITITALCAALAFLIAAVMRIPLLSSAPFLKFDLKDVILVMCGCFVTPLYGVIACVLAALMEFLTVSTSGLWGLASNIVSSVAFVLPAALLYAKKRQFLHLILGLLLGMVCMTAVMLLWNYLVTPFYMGTPRETVAAMLMPVFLPFNLAKSAINTTVTSTTFLPIRAALKGAHLIENDNDSFIQKL